jgi:hypothetical protein
MQITDARFFLPLFAVIRYIPVTVAREQNQNLNFIPTRPV